VSSSAEKRGEPSGNVKRISPNFGTSFQAVDSSD
jgi:hypothetical protein